MTGPPGVRPRARQVIGRVAGLAALAPPAWIAVLIARHARNMPWWDQWGIVPFMAEATRGHFPAALAWEQVNEHRIPAAMLLQGALAWATRWDARGDAWLNLAVSLGTLAALGGVVRRTVRPVAPDAAPWLVLVASVLVFSPAQGSSWTAGWITPTYVATCAACTFAWLLAGWRGSAGGFVALLLCATVGALAFGTGMLLLVLLPVAALVVPASPARRAAFAAVAAAWAAALLAAYFHGWHPRFGEPAPGFRTDRALEYVRYALAYVGRATGTVSLAGSPAWGLGMLATLAAAAAWLVVRCPELRPAVLPWLVLAAYGLGNGFVTAYGRLGNGAHTALLQRYLPTAALFVTAVVALQTLAIADLFRRSRVAAALALAVLVAAAGVSATRQAAAAAVGIGDMTAVAARLDRARGCLGACATTPEGCLASICFSKEVALRFCPLLEHGRIGPFRDAL